MSAFNKCIRKGLTYMIMISLFHQPKSHDSFNWMIEGLRFLSHPSCPSVICNKVTFTYLCKSPVIILQHKAAAVLYRNLLNDKEKNSQPKV